MDEIARSSVLRTGPILLQLILLTSLPSLASAEEDVNTTTSSAAAAPAEETASADRLDDVLAGADLTGTPVGPKEGGEEPPASAPPGQERPLPNYDGRPDPASDGADVLVWVPRVVFFPVHLVLEYGLRYPFVGFITFAEEYYLFDRIIEFFTWNDRKAGIFPRFVGDFGLRPTVGASLFWEDLFVEGNRFDASVTAWTGGWISVAAANSTPFFRNESAVLTLRGQFLKRPDKPFYGIGSDTLFSRESFYRIQLGEGEVALRAFLDGLNRIEFGVGGRDVKFSTDADNPSIDVRHDTAGVFGFNEGYELIHGKLRAEIDTRNPDSEFEPGTGVRLELFSRLGVNPNDSETSFFTYGGEIAGFWDYSGINHVLGIRLYTELLEPIGDNPVPFTELIALGGAEHMRGFLEGRFLGQSAFEITANYRYPVWSLLDADFFVSLGNAFDGRFEDFELDNTFLAYGGSLRTNLSREVSLELLLAFGTNRLDSDTVRQESTRFTVGVNHGF